MYMSSRVNTEFDGSDGVLPAINSDADPLDLEIFRYAVESVVDEMDINIARTAFSQLIYEAHDFCVGVLTPECALLNQSPDNLPVFVADLDGAVRDAVDVVGVERFRAGDIVLHNFAGVLGQHINNVTMITPLVTDEGDRYGYIAIRSHWADVGGLIPGSMCWESRSVLHEGVQWRGIKVVDQGEVVPEVLATLQANSWLPDLVTGDLMAQIAACKLGVARWHERVSSRWNVDEFNTLVHAQFSASLRLARAQVAGIPDGEYAAECRMDDSGVPGSEPLRMSVRLRVEGASITADLSDLPPQVEAPINAGRMGGAVTAMRVAFKGLLVPERPPDQALFEPLEVEIPDGTIVSATNNAPMSYWNLTISTMVDLFLRALSPALPELVPAGHHGNVGGLIVRGRRVDGGHWVYIDTAAGGFGAHAQGNGFGPLRTLTSGSSRILPVELAEARFPVRFESHRLIRDAGGGGRFRGGPAAEKTFAVLEDVTIDSGLDRTLDPAWGLAGGADGKPGHVALLLPGDDAWTQIGKGMRPIPAGTMVRQRSGGGGGWGAATDEAEPASLRALGHQEPGGGA
jgi:N-methylhydantoinase B